MNLLKNWCESKPCNATVGTLPTVDRDTARGDSWHTDVNVATILLGARVVVKKYPPLNVGLSTAWQKIIAGGANL